MGLSGGDSTNKWGRIITGGGIPGNPISGWLDKQLNIFQDREHPSRRAKKKAGRDIDPDALQGVEESRRRRIVGGGRKTILSGPLASSRTSAPAAKAG